jgi:hypothetical protein
VTGPSTPPDIRFDPVATALGVFVAVSVPIVVVGFARGGASLLVGIIALVIGIGAGVIAGIWVAGRDGKVWRGPQL